MGSVLNPDKSILYGYFSIDNSVVGLKFNTSDGSFVGSQIQFDGMCTSLFDQLYHEDQIILSFTWTIHYIIVIDANDDSFTSYSYS